MPDNRADSLTAEGTMLPNMSIQWFPGHMAKTRRLMKESLPLVDIIIELRDARIPFSSANPEMEKMTGGKPRIILLNKSDTADESATQSWCSYLARSGVSALAVDCRSGRGLGKVVPLAKTLLREELERREQRGMAGKPIRMMVVGIPNVGKSSFINRLAGGKRAKVEDRPGVTRGKQWVSLPGGVELLDMPGVLWPKFDDPSVGEHLAFTGAVRDDILDTGLLAMRLGALLWRDYPQLLRERYKLPENTPADIHPEELLNLIAKKRGMLVSGGEVDFERVSAMLLDEFRGGKLGRISLEFPGKPLSAGNRGDSVNEE